MDQQSPSAVSPHRVFAREDWARLRADTPLTLDEADVERLKSLNDPIVLDEVVQIYLPISRLLSLYVAAIQNLYAATRTFLGDEDGVMPFIIGVAGSVAVMIPPIIARALSLRPSWARRMISWNRGVVGNADSCAARTVPGPARANAGGLRKVTSD